MSKKIYLRSTKNLYYKDEDGIRIFYSYSTPVAFVDDQHRFFISQNVWSVTTAKHLNWVEDFNGYARKEYRIKNSIFEDELKKAQGINPDKPKNDVIKTTAMVSKLFGLLSTGDERAIEQKKRFFEIAGCTFPEDWDSLSLEEKTKRINNAEQFGLEGN
tara:strand:+ start:202 stop:678 length:477 start_codon:yes stop_codon:yes gene_type:complete